MSDGETDVVHAERIRALEKDVEHLNSRMDRFEDYCKETQQMYRESFADLNTRIEDFLNHQVSQLKASINKVEKTKRAPLSTWDWTKIMVTIITVAGTVFVALAEAGII